MAAHIIKNIIKTIFLIFMILFIVLTIRFFIYSNTIHGKAYSNAMSLIRSKDLMGLNFEQCYDMLYEEHWLNNIYSKLQNEEGSGHKISKDIDYSYYALFFACSATDGRDGRLKDYLYKLYFDENQQVVYAEVVPCKA